MTGAPARQAAVDCDVLVVGYGPVGQVLSLLLARRGWRVTVAEQQPRPYPMPRAVTFDGHAARIIAAAGAAAAIPVIGEPTPDYIVENGAGRTLLRIGFDRAGRHGWPDSTSMHQPALEAALCACASGHPRLNVLRGRRVTGLAETGPAVEAATQDAATGAHAVLRARWVVGCDGANSVVRDRIGASLTDFGFSVDWLACDVTPLRPADFPPENRQIADPLGPRVAVSAGPGRRRWEFMRMPGEPASQFSSPAAAWQRLAGFGVTPANARLDRRAVYTVQARCADRWRSGRILIAGDAAHQMPPFAGQGLCAGLRDAANLAWKLDLVLAGRQPPSLMDTYGGERQPNAAQVIRLSVWLGNLICMVDRAAADRRDAAMSGAQAGARAGAPALPDTLTTGLVHHSDGGVRADFAGSLLPGGRAGGGQHPGWLDAMAGGRFVFLSREDPATLLSGASRGFLRALGARMIQLAPPGQEPARACADLDDVYLPWLESMGAAGVLVRPDFYLYGMGRGRAECDAMVAGLRERLDPRASDLERKAT